MGHDDKLTTAIHGLVGWTAAGRSVRSTAHSANSAAREDAKLAIDISGALILRLVEFLDK